MKIDRLKIELIGSKLDHIKTISNKTLKLKSSWKKLSNANNHLNEMSKTIRQKCPDMKIHSLHFIANPDTKEIVLCVYLQKLERMKKTKIIIIED